MCCLCLACSVASCACSCATKACKCCGKAVSVGNVLGRALYTLVFFIFSIMAWIFRTWGQEIFDKTEETLNITCKDPENEKCYGTLTVYRVSFTLAVFHFVLCILTIGIKEKTEWRARHIQDGFWHIKWILLILGTMGSFLIPNRVFVAYGWVALGASGVFILLQMSILVDFAHTWAEHWIDRMNDSQNNSKKWFALLLTATILLYLVSVLGTIAMYISFSYIPVTKLFKRKVLNRVYYNLVQCESCTLLSSPTFSNPSTDCNPFYEADPTGYDALFVLFGAIFTIVVVVYSTMRAVHIILDKKEKEDDTSLEGHVSYNYSMFHFIFMLGALYIAMLMTDWHTITGVDVKGATVATGLGALWVKIVSSWLAILLYVWTLIAPVLFPNREF